MLEVAGLRIRVTKLVVIFVVGCWRHLFRSTTVQPHRAASVVTECKQLVRVVSELPVRNSVSAQIHVKDREESLVCRSWVTLLSMWYCSRTKGNSKTKMCGHRDKSGEERELFAACFQITVHAFPQVCRLCAVALLRLHKSTESPRGPMCQYQEGHCVQALHCSLCLSGLAGSSLAGETHCRERGGNLICLFSLLSLCLSLGCLSGCVCLHQNRIPISLQAFKHLHLFISQCRPHLS